MLRMATAGDARFAVDDCELERAGPSFTIDTVELIKRNLPEADLYYLIGEDNVAKLGTWHRIDELRELVRFVVFDRGGSRAPHPMPTLSRRIDISATEIRRRVEQNLPINYFVPEAIADHIIKHQLYQDQTH